MAAKASELGALILFSTALDRTVTFYRAIGVPLEPETHDDGTLHYACELGATHFAVFPAHAGCAQPYGSGGCSFPGFVVESVVAALDAARSLGATVRQEPEEYPWGLRAVTEDPDGRPVEIFQRHR
ncbi:MAG: VOC family protein [Candidatus Eremiobacteraeota bacterium]|nr:VOC family protein [Candidatus Eremiobacteraeota bacterium]MBV8668739.1 VOC family protein [Candidatus Eremiobacteraeota bacterium]